MSIIGSKFKNESLFEDFSGHADIVYGNSRNSKQIDFPFVFMCFSV
jgi:hypothetical protein